MRILLVAFFLSSVSLVAQQRPDFSGQWVLASSSSASAASELTLELCVADWFCGNRAYRVQRYVPANKPAQLREYLSVERRFRNQSMETFEMTVLSASVLSPFGTDRSDLFAAFEGQTLIIQKPTRLNPADEQILRKEIWSLTPEGLLRIITTRRPTGGEPVRTEAIYRKPQ